jgi:hypothetical protein
MAVSLDDIYYTIWAMEDLLAEWTETWGLTTTLWKQFEERLHQALQNNTAHQFKSEFITFVERTRLRVRHFRLARLAQVDLDKYDLDEVREGWEDALQVMEEALTWLAVADGIISIRLEHL